MKHDELTIAIPTNGRPQYLAILLSSLLGQTYKDFKVLLLPNGGQDTNCGLGDPPVSRMITTLEAKGHATEVIEMGNLGGCPAPAYNRAQIECTTRFLLCIDDDMWLEPNYLEWMIESFHHAEGKGKPVILSGLTPWMDHPWDGVGPEILLEPPTTDTKIVELIRHGFRVDGGKPDYTLLARQNVAYKVGSMHTLRPSDGMSPGNFMTRPSVLLATRSEVSNLSVFSDLFWVAQLRLAWGYSVWFDLRCNAWHVNAHSGGDRSSEGNYQKEGPAFLAQQKRLSAMMKYCEEHNGRD